MVPLAGVVVAIILGLVEAVDIILGLVEAVDIILGLVEAEAVAITLGLVVAVDTTRASPLEASQPFLQVFQALGLLQASPLCLPASQAQEFPVGLGQCMVVGVVVPQAMEEAVVVPLVGVGHLGHHMEQ